MLGTPNKLVVEFSKSAAQCPRKHVGPVKRRIAGLLGLIGVRPLQRIELAHCAVIYADADVVGESRGACHWVDCA
jgi:hypothetical protein